MQIEILNRVLKFFIGMKVKTKLFLLFASLIFALTLFLIFYFPYLLKNELIGEISIQSKSITKITATNIASAIDFNDMQTLEESLQSILMMSNIEYIIIVSNKNEILYSKHLENAVKYKYSEKKYSYLSNDGGVYQTYSPININDKDLGSIFIGYSLARNQLELFKTQVWITILLIIILVIALISSYYISSYFVRPLSIISHSFEEISNGNLSKRIIINTNDEIGALGISFNSMVDKLEEANIEMTTLNQSLETKAEELHQINATKDKFFSIIAHDLRNPLGSFKSIANFLHSNFEQLDNDDKIELLDSIRSTSDSVYSLLENLLEWANIQRNAKVFNPEIIQMNEIIQITFRLLKQTADTKKIILESNIEYSIELYADFNFVTTIFRNLVSNAIKFTNIGGKITIGCSRNSTDDKYVTFFVRDNGVGISKDIQEKLFRIDSKVTMEGTNQEKGTGLGLILCKEFIDYHNGKIWVESQLGIGTTFYFTLPKNPS